MASASRRHGRSGEASLHPGAHLGAMFGGGIEIRPVDNYDQMKR
jgi:hypothetical protein